MLQARCNRLVLKSRTEWDFIIDVRVCRLDWPVFLSRTNRTIITAMLRHVPSFVRSSIQQRTIWWISVVLCHFVVILAHAKKCQRQSCANGESRNWFCYYVLIDRIPVHSVLCAFANCIERLAKVFIGLYVIKL